MKGTYTDDDLRVARLWTQDCKRFFDAEFANYRQMQREGMDPPEPTLGSAIDSLTQAPDEVLDSWFITRHRAISLAYAVGCVGFDCTLDELYVDEDDSA